MPEFQQAPSLRIHSARDAPAPSTLEWLDLMRLLTNEGLEITTVEADSHAAAVGIVRHWWLTDGPYADYIAAKVAEYPTLTARDFV